MTKLRYINKPFDRLPLKQRACFILHLAGFSYRQIKLLLVTGMDTITKAIVSGYSNYHGNLGTNYPISED